MDTLSPRTLPDNVDALKGIVSAQASELHAKSLLIDKLKHQLAVLRRGKFGASSESLDQLDLLIEEMELERAEAAASMPAAVDDAQPSDRAKPARKVLPEHLPRTDVVHAPASDCTDCGKPMRPLSEDIREVLDYVPGRFVVTRHVRPKLSCRDCGTIAQAPMPSLPIERGNPGASLLAQVLVSKYGDHLPLYRQNKIFEREGITIERSTLADWVGRSAYLLQPLVDRLERHVFASNTIHTDDTPIPVLDPGRGKTKTGRLWSYVRDERPFGSDAPPAVFYKYTIDRKGVHPTGHLQGYQGFIHADGYSGYKKLFETAGVTEVACLAHIRRKLFDNHKVTQSPIAEEAIKRIAELYKIEKEIRGSPPEHRKAVRQKQSQPLFEDLQAFLDKSLPTVPGGSDLARAMRYAITRLKKLEVYLEHGHIEIDNNAAERSMKNLAVGKKNWLFAGSDKGGHRAATIYSLIETAKLNQINPQAWLTHVIDVIQDYPNKKIDDLLPWNWEQNDS